MPADLVPLASTSQIEHTPSKENGIPADLEEDLRAFGCKLIHEAGILLKQYVRPVSRQPSLHTFWTESKSPLLLHKFCTSGSGIQPQ